MFIIKRTLSDIRTMLNALFTILFNSGKYYR
jgi:hypothetical protein